MSASLTGLEPVVGAVPNPADCSTRLQTCQAKNILAPTFFWLLTMVSPPPNRSVSWKTRLLLVLLGLFLASMLLEICLRLSTSVRSSRARLSERGSGSAMGEYWAIYDPDLLYRGNPRAGELNSNGLRDHPMGPPTDRFRVLFLGDSVGYCGDTVDDTFVGHLRKELHRDPAYAEVEVINASMKGYSTYQELVYLKKYRLKFRPDVVGVQFCLNDLHKFLTSFRVENGQLVPGTYGHNQEAIEQARSWPRRMASKSYLLVWLKTNVSVAAKVLEWQAERGFSFDYNSVMRLAWQDKPWQEIEKYFREMRNVGRQNRISVFVVGVPLAVQYRADYLARDRDYVLKPQAKLREICETLGISFYDLYPEMNTELFAQDGTHLNRRGRELVGHRIASFLIHARLVESRGR